MSGTIAAAMRKFLEPAALAETGLMSLAIGGSAYLFATMFNDSTTRTTETVVYDHDGLQISVRMDFIDPIVKATIRQAFTVTSFWPDTTDKTVNHVRGLLVEVVWCLNTLALIEIVLDDQDSRAPMDSPAKADRITRRGVALMGQIAKCLKARDWDGLDEFRDACGLMEEELANGAHNARAACAERYM
jgi:hypothetical protein